jgi:hypothetical protein
MATFCVLLLASSAMAGPPRQSSIDVSLGPKAYRDGDVVEITDVAATSARLEQGDSVTVRGRVRLESCQAADLCLYVTQTQGSGEEETDPGQTVRVSGGLHDFSLKTTIKHRGVLHVTLYDSKSRNAIGGTYFGTADQMKTLAKWDVGYYLKK